MTKTRKQLLVFGSILTLGIGGMLTTAAFSDNAFVVSTLNAGTLQFTVNGEQATSTAPVTLDLGNGPAQPGDSNNGQLEIENTGTLPLTLQLGTTVTTGNGDLAAAADLTLTNRNNSTELYQGKANAAAFTGLNIPVGAKVTIDATLAYPGTINNTLQGQSDQITLLFTADQTN